MDLTKEEVDRGENTAQERGGDDRRHGMRWKTRMLQRVRLIASRMVVVVLASAVIGGSDYGSLWQESIGTCDFSSCLALGIVAQYGVRPYSLSYYDKTICAAKAESSRVPLLLSRYAVEIQPGTNQQSSVDHEHAKMCS